MLPKVLKGAQNAKQCSKLKKVLKRCSAQSGKAYTPDCTIHPVNCCCFWSQYLVVLIGQENTNNVCIKNTSPVAAVVFATRHLARAVHEHERTQDVWMVRKTA